jgi:hypothetical protein
MSDYIVEEHGSEFVLPLTGFICRGFRDRADGVELVLRSEDWRDDASLVINDESRRPQIMSLAAGRSRVENAVVSDESTLAVRFVGGVILEVAAGEYEEWEVLGPGEVHVVSPAGGGEPAIWDASSETYTLRPGDPLPPDLAKAVESFGLPLPTGAFEFRRTKGRTQSFELGPPRNQEEG